MRIPDLTRSLILIAALGPALPAQAEPEPPSITVTMSFPGGTLARFLDLVRGLDERINIVASEIAGEVALPAIELKQAPVLSALQSVSRIVPEDFKVRADVNAGAGGNPVFVLSIETRRTSQREQPAVQVFSLRQLTTPLPGEEGIKTTLDARTVLNAIEAGARVLGDVLDLRYHEESGLLFVKGSGRQVGLVAQVLQNIENDQAQLRAQMQRIRTSRTGAPAEEQREEPAEKPDGKPDGKPAKKDG